MINGSGRQKQIITQPIDKNVRLIVDRFLMRKRHNPTFRPTTHCSSLMQLTAGTTTTRQNEVCLLWKRSLCLFVNFPIGAEFVKMQFKSQNIVFSLIFLVEPLRMNALESVAYDIKEVVENR